MHEARRLGRAWAESELDCRLHTLNSHQLGTQKGVGQPNVCCDAFWKSGPNEKQQQKTRLKTPRKIKSSLKSNTQKKMKIIIIFLEEADQDGPLADFTWFNTQLWLPTVSWIFLNQDSGALVNQTGGLGTYRFSITVPADCWFKDMNLLDYLTFKEKWTQTSVTQGWEPRTTPETMTGN